MCDTNEEIALSKKIFKSANTVSEFMDLWSTFYENKICIPTYLSKFVGADDNPQATLELGKKLKEIAKRGFLAIDSQVGIPGYQKGYLVGFLPNSMIDIVIPNLNRYSGIIAFSLDIINAAAEGLFVTYDQDDNEIAESVVTKKMNGDPMTSVGTPDSLESIREWMSKTVRKLSLIHI